jgi:hypothetical protein
LLDGTRKPAGIIDWGDVHLVDYGIRENDAGMRDCGSAALRLAHTPS